MSGKYCSKCLLDKDSTEYHKRTVSPDGLQDKCKQCSKQATLIARQLRQLRNPEHDKLVKQKWYKKNSEISKARAKAYRLNNPEWAKEMDARPKVNWRQRYPEKAKALGKKQTLQRKLKKYNLSPE